MGEMEIVFGEVLRVERKVPELYWKIVSMITLREIFQSSL